MNQYTMSVFIIHQIQKIIWDDVLIDEIAGTVITVQNQGGSEMPILTKQLSVTKKSISSVMKAIEMGVVTETTSKTGT